MIKRFRVRARHPQRYLIQKAVAELERNNLVIFPTETLYGLGAKSTSKKAIRSLLRAKQRPEKKGFILLIVKKDQLKPLVQEIPPIAKTLIKKFWPGPLTLVFKKKASVSNLLSGNTNTIAIRFTSHPVARAIIISLNRPITAPSANISGNPPPQTALAAMRDLQKVSSISFALDAGRSPRAKPSTIVDVTGRTPIILREGAITKKRIMRALG